MLYCLYNSKRTYNTRYSVNIGDILLGSFILPHYCMRNKYHWSHSGKPPYGRPHDSQHENSSTKLSVELVTAILSHIVNRRTRK